MHFTGFYRMCARGPKSRFYVESARLARLGFDVGRRIVVEGVGDGLRVRLTEDGAGTNRITRRARRGRLPRPLLTFTNEDLLARFSPGEEFKVHGSYGCLGIEPTVRTFHIRRALTARPAYRILDVCAGGGTLSASAKADARYRVVAAHELDVAYADVLEGRHPDAALYLGDMRAVHPSEYPEFDILLAGLPCNGFSPGGQAFYRAAGVTVPELSPTGDLFIPFLELVAARMPLCAVVEQVGEFMDGIAGRLLCQRLRQLGYHVTVTELRPFAEWGEISDRRRLVIIATLCGEFWPKPPMMEFTGALDSFLDRPDADSDRQDAGDIAVRVQSMEAHRQRKKAQSSRNNFGLVYVDRAAPKIGVIKRTYWGVNYGPLLRQGDVGPRRFRLHEIEAIMGSSAGTSIYNLGVEILGQGVQGRIFRSIFQQLADFLTQP